MRGVITLIKVHQPIEPALLSRPCQRPELSATMVRDYLHAFASHPERLTPEMDAPVSTGALQCFAAIVPQEVLHEQL